MKCLGVFDIPIHQINPGQRLREPDGHTVTALAADIKDRGQLQAISVAKRGKDKYHLLGGMHRLAAISSFDKIIRCEVWDLKTGAAGEFEIAARLFEIDETIIRQDLTPLDRGIFLAKRKSIYEELYPETKAGVAGGKARQGSASGMFPFAEETAEKIGLSRSTVEKACRIGNMPAEIRVRLAGTPLAQKGVELYNLAKLEPEHLSKVVDLLLDEKAPATSVNAAVKIVEGNAPPEQSPEERQLLKLLDTWARATNDVKLQFLAHLRTTGEFEAEAG